MRPSRPPTVWPRARPGAAVADSALMLRLAQPLAPVLGRLVLAGLAQLLALVLGPGRRRTASA